jgi:hypothetical protein
MSSIGFTDSTNAFGPSARRLATRSARLRSRATTAARVSAGTISVNGSSPRPPGVRVRSATAANGATVTLTVFPTTLLARRDVLEATSSPAGVSTRAITYQ